MRRSRIQNGFTLMELLVSVAILSYCLSALLTTLVDIIALNDSTRNLLKASTHAELVMESIRNAAFATIPSNGGGAAWSAWTFDTAGVNGTGLAALKNEVITTTLSGTNPVEVIVTVSWLDLKGRSRSTVLRTLIAG